MSFWESRTARGWFDIYAMFTAASIDGLISCSDSIFMQRVPIVLRHVSTAFPIGICQGFCSPNSPLMETMVRKGKRPALIKDSILMQFPTPLLCIKSTPRLPPRWLPASRATPSSSVASGIDSTSGSSIDRSISILCPASGT